MSWIDKITNGLQIKTGDGKIYKPDWIDPKRGKNFNISEFEFPNLQGTLVDRKEPKGMRYELTIYFQGENHLEITDNFMLSADNKGFWTVTHPIYGELFVQPISIAVDESKFNVSEIRIEVIETLDGAPESFVYMAEDKVVEDILFMNEEMAENFDEEIPVSDIANIANAVQAAYDKAVSIVNDAKDAAKLYDSLKNALNTINNIASDVNSAISATLSLITAPALFVQSVQARIDAVVSNATSLKNNIVGSHQTVANMPKSLKAMFQTMLAANVSAMCLSSVTNLTDTTYSNRIKISDIIDKIVLNYNQYLADIDSMQVGDGNSPDDFIPNFDALKQLDEIVYFTCCNLLTLTFNSKQERFYTLNEDSNFILLASKLYGLKQDDSTIDELISNNNLGQDSLLLVKKDTVITYFV